MHRAQSSLLKFKNVLETSGKMTGQSLLWMAPLKMHLHAVIAALRGGKSRRPEFLRVAWLWHLNREDHLRAMSVQVGSAYTLLLTLSAGTGCSDQPLRDHTKIVLVCFSPLSKSLCLLWTDIPQYDSFSPTSPGTLPAALVSKCHCLGVCC